MGYISTHQPRSNPQHVVSGFRAYPFAMQMGLKYGEGTDVLPRGDFKTMHGQNPTPFGVGFCLSSVACLKLTDLAMVDYIDDSNYRIDHGLEVMILPRILQGIAAGCPYSCLFAGICAQCVEQRA